MEEAAIVYSFSVLGIKGHTNGWNPDMGDHLHFQLMLGDLNHIVDPRMILPKWMNPKW